MILLTIAADAAMIPVKITSFIIFLHELSHAIDNNLGNYKDYTLSEVVAELSACFLASLYGIKSDIGGTQKYIKSWSKEKHVALSIGIALERVKSIYRFINNYSVNNIIIHKAS